MVMKKITFLFLFFFSLQFLYAEEAWHKEGVVSYRLDKERKEAEFWLDNGQLLSGVMKIPPTIVHENVEYYSVNRAIKTLDRCDIVFLMIDSNEGLSEQDKKICSLAFERGRGIIFVLNKWDTQESQDKKAFKKRKEWINIMFGQMEFAPIVPLSALEGKGIKDLLDEAIQMHGQLFHKVDTAALNMALKDWLFKYPPPASKTAHFKIRYMTQKSTNPVSFLIFATRPEVVPETYMTYLKNRVREDLGFDKIPVQFEIKASRQKWEDRFEK